MEMLLDLLFGSKSGATPSNGSSVWGWAKLIIMILFALGAFRVLFIFAVKQKCTGFMMAGGRIVRRNMKPGWYLQIPFIYFGRQVFLGVRTLPFEEETRSQDQALVVVKGALHFRVVEDNADRYMFEVEEPDKVILERVLSAMRSAVSSKPAQESFEHKDAIATTVTDHVKAGVLRDVGIEVIEVPITEVAPHREVAAAFNAVQAAKRKQDESTALAEVKRTEARGDADAMQIRAEGQKSQLSEQALGLVEMLSILTGTPTVELPPEAAIMVMQHFLSTQMRTAFATGGRASTLVIPDDKEIIREVVNLLPTLVAHSEVDAATDPDNLVKRLEAKVGKDPKAKKVVEEFVGKAKAKADDGVSELIAKLPAFTRPLAKKIVTAYRRQANFGGGT